MFLFLGNHTYSQALNCTCPLTSPTPAISSEFHSKFPAVQRPFLHHSPEVPPTQHVKDEVIYCFRTKPDLFSCICILTVDISLFWSPKIKTLGLPSIASLPHSYFYWTDSSYWSIIEEGGLIQPKDDVNHWERKTYSWYKFYEYHINLWPLENYSVVFISFYFYFFYFWSHWVFTAVCGLSLAVESRGYSPAVVCRL